jgi:hypothetical protein
MSSICGTEHDEKCGKENDKRLYATLFGRKNFAKIFPV